MLLQEVGIYEYRHPLASVIDYEAALGALQAAVKECVQANQAVTGTKRWAINGSEKEGARMVTDFSKLMLRAYYVHYEAAANALRMNGDLAAVGKEGRKASEIQSAIEGVIQRAANIRAGYVYVISNIGAFGEGVVKIGMTRRLDPMDRVRELGDASAPFRFDVHALFFSDNAVGVETALHQQFAKRRVNFVNAHREFFSVTPLEVKSALVELQGNVLQFVEAPEALEWHQSQSIIRSMT